MLHNRCRRRSRVLVSSLKGLPMFTVSDLSLIQWPSRSGLASLRAGLSAVPRSAQTEVARSDISSLTGRLPSLGLSAAARIAKGGAETARTAESPRACQPRDGPETSDADSATGPPADSLGSATVLALPARALPRPAKPTAAALHASPNDRHRGAEIPGTDVAHDPLASPRAGSRLPLPGGGASPRSSLQGDACGKTQPSARRRPGSCNTRRHGDWYFDKSRKMLAKAPEIPDALVGCSLRPAAAPVLEFFPIWCAKTPPGRGATFSVFWDNCAPKIPTPARDPNGPPGTRPPQKAPRWGPTRRRGARHVRRTLPRDPGRPPLRHPSQVGAPARGPELRLHL